MTIDRNKFDRFVALDRKYSIIYDKLYDVGITLEDMTDGLFNEYQKELFWAMFPETKGKEWKWHINGDITMMDFYDWYTECSSYLDEEEPDYEWLYTHLNEILNFEEDVYNEE